MISVIIPALNAARTIGETVACLEAQDLADDYEVIVVDDGSTDATAEIAASSAPLVRLVRQDRAGPAAARNAGAEVAGAPVLAFTDADCFPEPSWLRRGLATLNRAELVQGAVVPDPRVEPRPFDRTISVSRETGLYETANLFVTRAAFDEAGGFEDWLPARIGKPLAEDVWFGWRVRRRTAATTFAGDAVVRHAVFRRGLVRFAGERLRLVYFPAMVAQVPEMRRTLLRQRVFLTPRSRAFDLLLLGASALFLLRQVSWLAIAVGVAASAPYVRLAARDAWTWRRFAPLALLGGLIADAVGFGALVWGSIRRRCLVI